MSWFSMDVLCSQCQHVWDMVIEKSKKDDPVECPECGGEGRRTLSAPMVMRASYHMGYKRGEAYELGKQAAKLRAERANMPHDKRDDINKEIADRQSRGFRKTNKTE